MKRKNTSSKKHSMQQVTKRLTAYSAAAGLGAFACGETAEAAVIYVDKVPDIVVDASNPTGGYFDMDGDTVPDFRIRFQAGYAPAAIRFQGAYASADLTNTAKGNTYYVRSFESGDLIGPGASEANAPGIVSSNASNFGNPTDPQYAGIRLDIGGSTHYGWVRIKTEYVGSDTTLTGTVFDWAYETTPETAIAAGASGNIPEPTSLALLAAGVGAFALRRRST